MNPLPCLGIVGSRSLAPTDDPAFTQRNYETFCFILRNHFMETIDGCSYPKFSSVVSGGAVGADQFAARWVKEWNGRHLVAGPLEIELIEFLPDWKTYGKRAGFLRNEDIVKRADIVLGLWDGTSAGTKSSFNIAQRLKKPTFIFYF